MKSNLSEEIEQNVLSMTRRDEVDIQPSLVERYVRKSTRIASLSPVHFPALTYEISVLRKCRVQYPATLVFSPRSNMEQILVCMTRMRRGKRHWMSIWEVTFHIIGI
ncbi:MAG: hypothetical protein CL912_31860 [Deltaproteobacteria bacterium]|nr:hypothetical protein [Deltaproteobacteria bacterium]